jgi:integrase
MSDAAQLRLFQLGLDLAALRAEEEKLMEQTKSPNTVRAYAGGWRVFQQWCHDAGLEAFPAAADTLALFLAWAKDRYAIMSIRSQMAAIAWEHANRGGAAACSDPRVRALLSAIAREQARDEDRENNLGKEALTIDQLRRMCRSFDDSRLIDLRDHAIILTTFASCSRRSEIARLQYPRDVKFCAEGAVFWIRSSKTDQEGEGFPKAFKYGTRHEYTCPVTLLKRWLKARGSWKGPLFVGLGHKHEMTRNPINAQVVCRVLKQNLERIGVDSDDYGAHSLRAGYITCAAERHASLRDIMDHSGQKSPQTVARYIKSAQRFARDPIARVL